MKIVGIGSRNYTQVVCKDEPGAGGACHEYEIVRAGENASNIEDLARMVHNAYLVTCVKLGWPVKESNNVPYEALSEDSKELDRASVRAVLSGIGFSKVSFQNGPIKENGVNGCHQEDLIAICIDRLQCFQKGEYACRENAVALTKLEEALMWLRKRTQDRIDRGVEGTSQK